LYKNVQDYLTIRVLGLLHFLKRRFSTTSRSEIAIDYYDKHIFRGKTFADLHKSGDPFILINASDLTSRSQFPFIQLLFDFFCSDLSQFKVARAVAASSAVPLLFQPILIEKHTDCNYQKPEWLTEAENRAEAKGDHRLKESIKSLNYYLGKGKYPYATLVDGGISDNLGLRTLLLSTQLTGEMIQRYERSLQQLRLKRVVVILVNAATHSDTHIGKSRILPSLSNTLNAVTDMQFHLYNTETKSLFKHQLKQWVENISTEEHPITPYFIELNEAQIEDPEKRAYFNNIPTSFKLDKEQVDMVIDTAGVLLRQNPEYQKLLHELDAHPAE
jgi:NTE family protein